MNKYWFQNPKLLLSSFNKKDLNKYEKNNTLAKIAFVLIIIIYFLNIDTKYMSVPFTVLIILFLMGLSDNFENSQDTNNCVKPTANNPYMNFTIGDHMTNPNRNPACSIDDENIRDDQIKFYRNGHIPDVGDLYGKTITDRNFYTMPSTTIVNDQEGFLNFLYGDFGKCKSEGKNCLKHQDNRFFKGRYYYQY